MSSYATLDDVQQRMPQFTLRSDTRPSLDTAQIFLDDTESEFEAAMLNLGYVIPITGPLALKQCRELVARGAIAKILYARSAAVGTDVAIQSAQHAQQFYDDGLKALLNQKDPRELVDAQRTGDELSKPTATIDGLTVDDCGNEIEPRVTMRSIW